MEWSIDFYRHARHSHVFINQLFYVLVSQGATYNGCEHKGYYSIIGSNPEDEIYHFESDESTGVEAIANILETYRGYDLSETSLTIGLCLQGPSDVHFSVVIIPTETNKTHLRFETTDGELTDSASYDRFISLCTDVFETFEFVFGTYRPEDVGVIPMENKSIRNAPAQLLTFYSSEIVDDLGRDHLLGTPADEVSVLDDGGVVIHVRPERFGGESDLLVVRDYLDRE